MILYRPWYHIPVHPQNFIPAGGVQGTDTVTVELQENGTFALELKTDETEELLDEETLLLLDEDRLLETEELELLEHDEELRDADMEAK